MLLSGESIEQVKFAVQGIASRAGVNSEQPQTMINGDSIETNSDIFESSAQVIDAMNDPRYAKDPAFRKLVEEKIDYALLLAWNFADEIMENLTDFKKSGGKFIVPIPNPKII